MSVEEKVEKGAEKICDFCKFFMRLMDPCDDKWYGQEKMKAVCVYKRRTIVGGLEPYELKNIEKPKWCPKDAEGQSKS